MQKNKISQIDEDVMFLFRPQRGSLDSAMSEVKGYSSKQMLIDDLQAEMDEYGVGKYDCSKTTIEKYGSGIDKRIGWDTYIVHLEEYGVFGFTNGPAET